MLATLWFDLAVVLPCNVAGGSSGGDSGDLTRFTIANVPNNSPLLWAHAVSVVLKTAAVLYLVAKASEGVSAQQGRAASRALAAAAPATRTLLADRIAPGTDVAALMERTFGEGCVEVEAPVVDHSAVAPLASLRAALHESLAASHAIEGSSHDGGGADKAGQNGSARAGATTASSSSPPASPRSPRLLAAKPRDFAATVRVPAASFDKELFDDVSLRLAALCRAALSKPRPSAASRAARLLRPAVFLTFVDAATARRAAAAHAPAASLLSPDDAGSGAAAPSASSAAELVRLSPAPDPADVVWANVGLYDTVQLRVHAVVAWALTLLLCAAYLAPASAITALSLVPPDTAERGTASALSRVPALSLLAKHPSAALAVEGATPPVLLACFSWVVPLILRWVTFAQGATTEHDLDRGMIAKSFLFSMFVVFLSSILSGDVSADVAAVVTAPLRVPNLLASRVPGSSHFFFSYALIQGIAASCAQLARWWQAVLYAARLRRGASAGPGRHGAWPAEPQPLGRFIPHLLLQILVLLIYSTVAPIMQPIQLLYFLCALLVAKSKVFGQHEKRYESHGRMWPLIRRCVVASLLLYQVVMSALFANKGVLSAAVLTGLFTVPPTLFLSWRMTARHEALLKRHASGAALAEGDAVASSAAVAAEEEMGDRVDKPLLAGRFASSSSSMHDDLEAAGRAGGGAAAAANGSRSSALLAHASASAPAPHGWGAPPPPPREDGAPPHPPPPVLASSSTTLDERLLRPRHGRSLSMSEPAARMHGYLHPGLACVDPGEASDDALRARFGPFRPPAAQPLSSVASSSAACARAGRLGVARHAGGAAVAAWAAKPACPDWARRPLASAARLLAGRHAQRWGDAGGGGGAPGGGLLPTAAATAAASASAAAGGEDWDAPTSMRALRQDALRRMLRATAAAEAAAATGGGGGGVAPLW